MDRRTLMGLAAAVLLGPACSAGGETAVPRSTASATPTPADPVPVPSAGLPWTIRSVDQRREPPALGRSRVGSWSVVTTVVELHSSHLGPLLFSTDGTRLLLGSVDATGDQVLADLVAGKPFLTGSGKQVVTSGIDTSLVELTGRVVRSKTQQDELTVALIRFGTTIDRTWRPQFPSRGYLDPFTGDAVVVVKEYDELALTPWVKAFPDDRWIVEVDPQAAPAGY